MLVPEIVGISSLPMAWSHTKNTKNSTIPLSYRYTTLTTSKWCKNIAIVLQDLNIYVHFFSIIHIIVKFVALIIKLKSIHIYKSTIISHSLLIAIRSV